MAFRVPVLETFNWQKVILEILDAIPTMPNKGDRYIVGLNPTGDWVGKSNQIAWFDGTDWQYDVPTTGWYTFDIQTKFMIWFDGTTWKQFGAELVKVDVSNFTTQMPNNVSTLQELLEWMDTNMGGPGPMGLPSDGTFADGLIEWETTTKMNDALDDLNEIMKDLAPAQANTLNGTTLVNNRTIYSGKLPDGLSSNWYQDGKSAGSTVNNVITDSSIRLTSPSQADTFSKGDEGYLIGMVGHGSNSLEPTTKLNIQANFVEPTPGESRVAVQDLTTWDFKENVKFPCADCDTPVNGVVTKGTETLAVTSVGKYNNFNMWQKMNAYIESSSLLEGFHQFMMRHVVRGTNRDTLITKIFRDDSSADTLSFSSNPTVTEENLTSNKYLSGIRYYSTGDSFRVQYTGNNIYKKIYRTDRVTEFSFNGVLSSTKQYNPSSTPSVDDPISVDDVVSVEVSNTYQINARVTASLLHPYKVTSSSQSASENRLINTYPNTRSTSNYEYFTDEQYRLPQTHNFDQFASYSNIWDSTQPLGATDALVFNQQVQYPNLDFTNYLPSGPNYTGRVSPQVYSRAFLGASKSSGILSIVGLSLTDVSPVGSGNVNIEIKLPGQTGWLDAGKPFNSGTFSGVDGDGCKNEGASSGTNLAVTFGTFNTANCGNIVYVRVTFRVTGKSIQSGFRFTNW